MNPLSDKYIREQIASLDHISPPTNWNAENTWHRVAGPKIWYKRKVYKAASLAVILLFLLTFFWPYTNEPTGKHTGPIYLTEIEIIAPPSTPTRNKLSTPTNKEVVSILTDTVQMQEVNTFLGTSKEEAASAHELAHTAPVKEKHDTAVKLIIESDSTSHSQLAQKRASDSTSSLREKKEEIPRMSSPVISISLHADHSKKTPQKVQRSIIKLRNDYRYTTSKKVYSLQINK